MKSSQIIIIFLFIAVLQVRANEYYYLADSLDKYYNVKDIENASKWRDSLITYFDTHEVKKDTFQIKSLNLIANLYYIQRNYDDYYRYFYKSIAVSKEFYGEKSLRYPDLLLNLASKELKYKSSDSAKLHINQSIDIINTLEPIPYQLLGKALSYLGAVFVNEGNIKEGEEYYLKAFDIFKNYYKDDDLHYAITLNNLSYVNGLNSNYEKSVEYTQLSIAMQKRLYGEEYEKLYAPYTNLANTHALMGKFYDAIQYYYQSIEYLKNNNEEFYENMKLSIKTSIAAIYFDLGDFIKSEQLFKEVINNISHKILFYQNTAYIYSRYANFLQRTGRYDLSNEYFLKAKLILDSTYIGDHIDKIDFYDNYFKLKYIQNDPESINLLTTAEEMAKRLFTKPNIRLFKIQSQIADYYFTNNDLDNFKNYLDSANNTLNLIFKETNLNHANIASKYGDYYKENKGYSLAKDYYLQAKNILDSIYTEFSPEYIRNEFKLAELEIEQSRIENVKSIYLNIFSKLNNKLNDYFKYFSTNDIDVFFNNKIQGYYKKYLRFLVENKIQDQELLKQAFNNRLFNKSKLLDISANKNKFTRNIQDTSIQQIYDKYLELNTFIAKAANFKKSDLIKRNLNIDSLIQLSNYYEEELRDIVFSNSTSEQNLTNIDEIISYLNDNDAIIDIFSLKSADDNQNYYALIYVKSDDKYYLSELSVKESDLDIFRNEISTISPDNFNLEILENIYASIWNPIKYNLKDTKKIYLSPDGELNSLNFAILFNPQSNKYLADEIDISTLTSLKRIKYTNQDFSSNELKIELFGNPEIEINSDLSKSDENNLFLRNVIKNDSAFRSFLFTPLPNTEVEINQIADLLKLKKLKYEIHIGNNANENILKNIENPSILHLATHGKFISDNELSMIEDFHENYLDLTKNPLLRSFLIFSKPDSVDYHANWIENYNDGYLTAYEAMYLNLENTDLVVLSACESGLGVIKNGEGVYGLQRAFFYAGAKNIIMSLWKVYDKPTREFMVSFYKFLLDSNDINSAFKNAQIELKSKYPNPYIWGSFVLIQG